MVVLQPGPSEPAGGGDNSSPGDEAFDACAKRQRAAVAVKHLTLPQRHLGRPWITRRLHGMPLMVLSKTCQNSHANAA